MDNTPPIKNTMKLLITIVDREKGKNAVDIYRAAHLHFDFVCLGLGTASSKILNYFGLAETAKDIVITLAPSSKVHPLMKQVSDRFQLQKPGKGILFSIPLSGISGQIPLVLMKPEYQEELNMNEPTPSPQAPPSHDLILTILNRGYTDLLMDAAKSAGAQGGTVLLARRVGYEDAQNLLGFTLQPEKEIIAILVPREKKHPVMQAINKVAGLTTECQGILFSLPVEDIMGLENSSNL